MMAHAGMAYVLPVHGIHQLKSLRQDAYLMSISTAVFLLQHAPESVTLASTTDDEDDQTTVPPVGDIDQRYTSLSENGHTGVGKSEPRGFCLIVNATQGSGRAARFERPEKGC